ncbi:MAG: LamG domain-containing protein, partial [Bacteroidota bacterium]
QERWKISLPPHGKPVFTTHANNSCCSDMDSGTPLSVGVWTHVVMVHDGSKNIIYFNGARVNEKNVAGALDQTVHPLGIGYDPIDNNFFFDGAMDDVMLYDQALTDAQIASLYATQSAAPAVAQGNVASYSFDRGGIDASTFGNHLDLGGAVGTTDRFGFGSSALLCNGENTEPTAANSAQLNAPYTTVSFWVKPSSLPGNGEAFLLSLGGWQERWKISLPSHGKPVFTTHPGFCCSDMDSGTPLTVGAWTHVAMVHDGSKDIIYFNGSKVNEKNVSGALDATTKPLGIGFDPIDNNYFFDGSLDEVQIYNAALSDAEIAALYAEQSTPVAGGDITAPSSPLNLSADVLYTNVTLSWLASPTTWV